MSLSTIAAGGGCRREFSPMALLTEPDLVLVEKPIPGCALLTLNRPHAMNALTRALMRELAATIDALGRDPEVRVLVLTGAGRAFCAGLDLKELGRDPGGAESLLSINDDVDPVSALGRFAGPVIGAINGAAVTGGLELALACDVLIASSAARFADTHARVGLMPAWGLSQKLSRMIGVGRAKELSLSGNFLSAERAEAWGLANRVVAPDELLPQALGLASDMVGTVPSTLRAMKRLIDDGFAGTLADGLALERSRSRESIGSLNAAGIEQRREGVRARGRAQGSQPN